MGEDVHVYARHESVFDDMRMCTQEFVVCIHVTSLQLMTFFACVRRSPWSSGGGLFEYDCCRCCAMHAKCVSEPLSWLAASVPPTNKVIIVVFV